MAAAAEPRSGPAIRPVGQDERRLLDETLAGSATARAIAAELAATDVIVYVAYTPSPAIKTGTTALVITAGTWRYVRIQISRWLAGWDHGPVLAHELWHAVEIARAPDVRDDAGMRLLYRNARTEVADQHRFDTAAARDVQRTVHVELRRSASRS
jgi:hypothetical protein